MKNKNKKNNPKKFFWKKEIKNMKNRIQMNKYKKKYKNNNKKQKFM